MKTLTPVRFDPVQCSLDLDDFGKLLASREELSETRDVLPFFRSRPNLSALLGLLNPRINRLDQLIGYEYRLYGDFVTDLVVGDPAQAAFCFIEFEDAVRTSVFTPGSRSVPVWATRFTSGFGQVVDWFWKLAELQGTPDFLRSFGSHSPDFSGVLVIGRSAHLAPRERERLRWFRQNVLVHSKHVYCCTFDELYEDLKNRFLLVPRNARIEGAEED